MFLTLSFFCASVEVKNEVFSRSDSSGASGGEWYILSDDKPFEIIDEVVFGQPGSDIKKIMDIAKENLGYIQSNGWGNLSGTGNRWKFSKPEKVDGEIIVYYKKSDNSAVIKYNINAKHKNSLYNEHAALIKICEINGKRYSYTQNKEQINKLQIAYEKSLPENIAKRAELEKLKGEKLAEQEEKEANKKYEADLKQERIEIWESDSNVILSMISGLRNIEEDKPDDSDLQREHKLKMRKKKYKEEFSRIKKTYYNKPFSLQAAMVDDVVMETKFNKEGQRKLKEVEQAFKTRNPLHDFLVIQFEKNKYKYEVETGFYEIRFSIPVPDNTEYSSYSKGVKKEDSNDSNRTDIEEKFNVTVILIVKSKGKALTFSKGDVIPINGKIKEIEHGYSFMDEYLKIKLAE
jgi:hypothetical protein